MFDLFPRDSGKVATLSLIGTLSLVPIAAGAGPVVRQWTGAHALALHPRVTATAFYAGGATLPALGYNGVNPPVGSNGPVTPAAGSAYYYFLSEIATAGDSIHYCLTGSGEGKKVFEGVSGFTANLSCNPTSGNQGFSAPATRPSWATSDSPLSQSDYSSFTYGATNTEPTQLPTVVGSIALLYNNKYITSPSQINITTATLCKLADGQITTWQSLATQSGTTIKFSASIPANYPLYFGYRTDGSGTTFNFSNFLSANCPKNGGQTYALDPQYLAVAPSTEQVLPQGNSATNLMGAKGNNGLTTLITGMSGAIGYVEAANAKAARSAPTINFATLNSNDPISAFPKAVSSVTETPYKDAVIAAYVPNGRPVGNISGTVLSKLSPTAKKAGCVLVQDPDNFATLASTSGYQIIAFSYHEFYESGNGASAATDLSKLALMFATPSDFGTGKITTINAAGSSPGAAGTGYSSVPSASQSAVKTAVSTTKCINA